jgi:hypothetical protein
MAYITTTIDKGKTRYKYVRNIMLNGLPCYQARYTINDGNANSKVFTDLREAAKSVDLYLISKGREPVNILKRK